MRLLLLSLFLMLSAYCQPALLHAGDLSGETKDGGETGGAPSLGPIRFYQKYLSPAIGGSCPMTPSCSSYCVHAVKKHGLLKGWVMTCDRLMRCGRDEVKRAPLVRSRYHVRHYDPVSENDFWQK